jgi:ABC-type antimicrobial peptide transport system permease subunit
MVRGAAPSLPMTDFRTLDEQVHRSLNSERMLATLSASFSALALLLSVIGLYGVMSFVVTQRTHEIGIRLALGARRWSTLCLVLRNGLVMIVSGIAIGLPLVLALGRLVESQLYEVKSWDPAVIAIAILALCLAGLVATLLPAHRASGVNAIDALRVE